MKRILGRSTLSFISSLSTFIGVWALLVAPGLAQVNGPGPSPSSSFDIVLNLPGDEAIITGDISEQVGGGMVTTQLNVSDGGVVGQFFNVLTGGEVNISGGTIGSIRAFSGSEVNILSLIHI